MKLVHNFEDEKHHYIVMEYCEGIELFEIIKQAAIANEKTGKKGALDEETAAWYMKNIALGVKFMHDRQILHRDLKPGNIMITGDKKVKIIDMGLARRVNSWEQEEATMCGTPNYISPETLDNKRHGT